MVEVELDWKAAVLSIPPGREVFDGVPYYVIRGVLVGSIAAKA